MDQIAIVGQNEMQRTIQGSYEKYLEEGVSPSDVKKTESTSEVTNDKGLTIEASPVGVNMRGLSPVAKHEIGAPSVQQGKVGGLLKNLVKTFSSEEESVIDERVIVRLQGENDNAMRESSFKRNEGVRQGVNEKFEDKVVSLRVKNGISDGPGGGEVAGKVTGVAGAAVGFALALAFTIVTGGAGVAALVASAVGLAMSITEAAGGFEEMQKVISESLQKTHPFWTKEECDRWASIITTIVQVAIEIAETVVSFKAPNPVKNLSGTVNTLKNSTAPTKIINEKIFIAGTETAKQVYNVKKPTVDQVNTVIKSAEKAAQIEKPFKYIDSGVKLLGMGAEAWNMGSGMKKDERSREIQSNLELSQADQEQILSILSDCGLDLNRINNNISRTARKLESILSSQTQGLLDIEEITSDIGG